MEKIEIIKTNEAVEYSGIQTLVEDTLGKDSTNFNGKYENADELWKAYKTLQADYTRKCQEVATLKHKPEQSNASVAKNNKAFDSVKVPTVLGAGAQAQGGLRTPRSLRDADILAKTLFTGG